MEISVKGATSVLLGVKGLMLLDIAAVGKIIIPSDKEKKTQVDC